LLATQWASLNGIDPAAMETRQFGDARCDQWRAGGAPIVELWSLPALGHDWPPIAVQHIARFWSLAAG
jgi:poly(3-hydroxybutyrate) depolymerase